MKLPVVVGPAAAADLKQGFEWHSREGVGVAHRFLADVARTLGHIEWFPTGYQFVDGDVRRAVTRRYRTGVFYRIHPEEVYVLAILSTRDDPEQLERRIASS